MSVLGLDQSIKNLPVVSDPVQTISDFGLTFVKLPVAEFENIIFNIT